MYVLHTCIWFTCFHLNQQTCTHNTLTHSLTHTHTHTQTCKHRQSRTTIFDSLLKWVCACSTYYRQLWDTLCVKLRTHNLCMTLERWTKDQTLCTLFSLFFSTYPYICKSRQFATVCTYPQIVDRPHCNVVLGLMVGVSEYVLGWRCLQTHTHSLTHTHRHVLDLPKMDKSMWMRESMFCNMKMKIPCVEV